MHVEMDDLKSGQSQAQLPPDAPEQKKLSPSPHESETEKQRAANQALDPKPSGVLPKAQEKVAEVDMEKKRAEALNRFPESDGWLSRQFGETVGYCRDFTKEEIDLLPKVKTGSLRRFLRGFRNFWPSKSSVSKPL